MNVKGTVSEKLLSYIDRVAEYFDVYDVDIEFVKTLNGNLGECYGDTDWCYIEIARNDVDGNRIPTDQLKVAIAHEMTHAWQMLTGRLNLDSARWNGKCYKGVDYQDLPWEHEAYEMENIVYEDCK